MADLRGSARVDIMRAVRHKPPAHLPMRTNDTSISANRAVLRGVSARYPGLVSES